MKDIRLIISKTFDYKIIQFNFNKEKNFLTIAYIFAIFI
jgi:hypothetical protein